MVNQFGITFILQGYIFLYQKKIVQFFIYFLQINANQVMVRHN